MGALTHLAPVILLMVAAPAHADGIDRWHAYIDDASVRFGVPSSWIERVMRAESRGLTTLDGHPIRSRAGAMGLMQLMPTTWTEMRMQLGLGNDPDDPHDNILAGTFYLRLLFDRFGYPGLFGAYNAGPAGYDAYLVGKRRLPAETIAYLATVGGEAQQGSSPPRKATPPTLFAIRIAAPLMSNDSPELPEQPSMFAVRHVVP